MENKNPLSDNPQAQERYTLVEIKEAIIEELIDAYGGLSKNRDGLEIDQPYFVLGVFHSACNRLPSSPSSSNSTKELTKEPCEHRFATLVRDGGGLMRCSDCGEEF